MEVYLYQGGKGIVAKSGIGQAVLHQKKALEKVGVRVVTKPEKKTKIIHINTIFPDSLLACMIAKRKGKKVIWYAHSTMEDFKSSFCGSDLFAPLFKRWICFCYSMGDIIITPTAYSRQLLLRYGLKKTIYHLSNGVDTDFFQRDAACGERFRTKYHIGKEEKVVISVGHMIERKGILDFIALAKQMPEIRFLWFGYTDAKFIPAHVKKAMKHAPRNLMFAGYVNQSELRDAYCGADVFAFLSKEETEGIVVLEALACGIPTILRDIPVYDGWLQDGKQVYKVRSVSDGMKKVQEVFAEDHTLLVKNGRKTAESRSLERIGKRLKAIYQISGIKEGK
ncbi:MAG: glycosyltransferase family 4 protein [Lachnospiraceae bacterium]|nr:glycosyltransferase family 4 protein [Lachnospiraceae bacterium]